jgi:hypothetical protein
MTLWLAGSMARLETARFDMRSWSGAQDAPPFVDFHTPPATPAAYMTFASVGSMRIALVRPPMFPGPSAVHVPSATFGPLATLPPLAVE